ncbi:MAG: hypothetical protein ACLQBY_04310 [Solirubrobacteraceae bacterium]
MAPLACLMHWYISMMYVVPVVAVGGWGWLSSKRMARRKSERASGRGAPPDGAAGGGSQTATVA